MNNDELAVPSGRRWSLFEGIVTFAIVTALLYFGAGIFVPLVLAVLLAFALTPVVSWLSKTIHLPDPIAVIVSVLLALLALGTFTTLAGHQIVGLAQALPGYQDTISSKVGLLQQQFTGLTLLDQFQSTIAGLGDRFAERSALEPQAGAPIPVTISNEIGPLGLLTSVLGSIIGPVATVAIVAVFLIFLLLGRQDLQDRFIRLVSAGNYSLTSIAISDASRRVGRYLIIQLLVNIAYGTIFGLGLWIIGVPSAPLWGLLIILFRYIPFVGALIIAVIPFMLAFAVDPGWSMLIWTVALFLLLDLTTANVIEPRLYGSSTGVSPIAILLSAMFWAALWGPVGLILATPMTVCLVVIGRHLPQLRFFETLLGSEPVLDPPERVYNRLLKGDGEGAIAIGEEFVEDRDATALVDDILLPVLQLAERERSDEPQALSQRRVFADAFNATVSEFYDTHGANLPRVLLVAGRTDLDLCAAHLLELRLGLSEVPCKVLPAVAIRQEAIGRLDLAEIDTVVLVYLGSDIKIGTRYAARRLRRMSADIKISVCALHIDGGSETSESLYADSLYRSLQDTVDALSRTQAKVGLEDAGVTVGLGRGDDAVGQALDRLADRFGLPVATINLLSDERHREETAAYALTTLILEKGKPLVIGGESNVDLQNNLYLHENGVRLFVGVPLLDMRGEPLGTLVLMGYDTQAFGDSEIEELQLEAQNLLTIFYMQNGSDS